MKYGDRELRTVWINQHLSNYYCVLGLSAQFSASAAGVLHVISFVVAEFVPGILPIITVSKSWLASGKKMWNCIMKWERSWAGMNCVLFYSLLLFDDECLRQLEIFEQCEKLPFWL